MSTRSIIEINHDQLRHLKDDPEWAHKLYMALGWSNNAPPQGVKIVTTRHHSEDVEVIITTQPGIDRHVTYG